jgi:hypothetical protein
MKLSELVHLKNQLDNLSTAKAQEFTNLELAKITHLIDDPTLEQDLTDLNTAFDIFNNTVYRIKADLKSAISEAEKPWFQESYRLHEEEICTHPTDHILNTCIQPLSTEFKNIIDTRLNVYSSWHHAAMVIRPGNTELINRLVSFDPLYILDRTYDLLALCVGRFPEQYQERLRQYTIEDVDKDLLLEKIPAGQFALCVAYMYFNYKPLEVIKQYFSEIHEKLKPGGTLAFTFNDCDRIAGVKLVEQRFCCYTPGYLIKELARSIGFEITYEWFENHEPVTWLELKKPGVLTSIKGGQSLGKIVPK